MSCQLREKGEREELPKGKENYDVSVLPPSLFYKREGGREKVKRVKIIGKKKERDGPPRRCRTTTSPWPLERERRKRKKKRRGISRKRVGGRALHVFVQQGRERKRGTINKIQKRFSIGKE